MNRYRWAHIAAFAALLGGAAWSLKFLVIATTGDSAVVGVLYVTAVLLLFIGSTWIGTKLAGDRSRALLAVLIVVSPAVFWYSYMAIDAVAVAVVGDAGPWWLDTEAGILATGLAWMALGAFAVRDASSRPRAARSAHARAA